MNLNNQNNDIIGYREPFNTFFRHRQRRLASVTYNDRSPEVKAMNAHFRASAYPEEERASKPISSLEAHHRGAAMRDVSFLNLLREYDNQARDNFSKEAVLFVIITAIGLVWPLAYTFSALLR